jgi:hypothetical protein
MKNEVFNLKIFTVQKDFLTVFASNKFFVVFFDLRGFLFVCFLNFRISNQENLPFLYSKRMKKFHQKLILLKSFSAGKFHVSEEH